MSAPFPLKPVCFACRLCLATWNRPKVLSDYLFENDAFRKAEGLAS